jgi:hypothetical protein
MKLANQNPGNGHLSRLSVWPACTNESAGRNALFFSLYFFLSIFFLRLCLSVFLSYTCTLPSYCTSLPNQIEIC